MKVTASPNDFPVCACGRRATEKLSSCWVCARCVAIDKQQIGDRVFCGVPFVGVQGLTSGLQGKYEDWGPIAGESLKHLEAMLA